MPTTKERPVKKAAPAETQHHAVLRITCNLTWEGSKPRLSLGAQRLPVGLIYPKVYALLKHKHRDGGEVLITAYPKHTISGREIVFTIAHATEASEHPDTPASFTGILDPARVGELLLLPKNHPAFGLNIEGLPAVPRRGVFKLPSVILTPAMQLRSIAEPEWVGAA